MITIPAFIKRQFDEIERLMFKFGNCRRRAYSMKQDGVDRLEILRQLHRETKLPTRYVYTAYDMIEGLPPHVTFGGVKLQRLREREEISLGEFHKRRNSLLACRGDASNKGNVCLRVERKILRVNIGSRRWIRVPLFIPEKYAGYLNDSKPYTVLIKRRENSAGYDVRITVDVKEPKIEEPKRIMPLDINSGHVDFAVADKQNLKPIAFGKINCHELLHARKGKKQIITHKLVNKVTNIAKHYGAQVVTGKLNTIYSKGRNHANRKAQGMCQYKLRQVMRHKLPINGVHYNEKSEAHTSKVGEKLSKPLGLDIHKSAAYAFAVKIVNYPVFSFFRGVCTDEGDGILSARLNGGSGPTALHQALSSLMHDEAKAEATPKSLDKGGGPVSLQTSILQVKV